MKKHHPIEVILIAFMIAGLIGQPLALLANPVGGTVVAGSATITGGPGSMVIHQSSQRAIINWKDFSIGVGEVTKFVQPSASAAVLNRVVGMNPTRIYGTLEGNGHVYVINENGILVGSSGIVNTRAFLASTLEVSDAAFLNGGTMRFSGQSSGGILNAGRINALGGDVFFISRTIENQGRISARQGSIGLAAGSEVILQQSGSERISVIAGKAGGGTGIDNSGTIEAVNAELKAAGGNVYALAIHNGGVVRATGFARDEQGRLVLKANGGNIQNSGILAARNEGGGGGTIVVDGGHNEAVPATVINEGEIIARGDARRTEGGTVRMTGDYVGLFGRGLIDVSGHSGGGVALVGGGFQGSDAGVQNALRTIVAPEASIRADALSTGDGGKVVVWSEDLTRVYGSLLARGGSGGLIETSSRGSLDLIGAAVNAGVGGLWLLDPGSITIASPGTPITPEVDFVVGAADADVTVDPDSIVSALNNHTSVKLSAAGDITVNAALVKSVNPNTTVPTLTLEAGNNILIKGNAVISSTAGRLNIVLNADSDAGGLGNGTGSIRLEQAASNPLPGRLDSNGGTIDLHAADLVIENDEGTIDSNDSQGNGGLITITASANRNLGLGVDPGTALVIGGSELQRITSAGGLRLATTGAGQIQVDGISSPDSANITGKVLLDSGGPITFSGAASTFNILEAASNDGISLNMSITTSGGQTYSGPVTLAADTTLSASTVQFNDTVDGSNPDGERLSITGNAVFGDGAGDFVGDLVSLRSVSVAGSATFNAGNLGASTIKTLENQTYGSAILNGDTTLTGATVQFNGKVNGANGGTGGLTVTGNAVFGATVQLESVDVSLIAQINGGSINTVLGQKYGSVVLGHDTTLSGTTFATPSGLSGGGHDLNLNFSGITTIDGALLSNVGNLSAGGGGTTIINGGMVQTQGTQTYDEAVQLSGDVNLSGTTVTFNGTVDGTTAGQEALTVTGNAVFTGSVGSGIRLQEVNVSGATTLDVAGGEAVTTFGPQNYGGSVLLSENTVLNGSTISFNNTVNGARSLKIKGNAVFGNGAGDFVGDSAALVSVTVSGATTFNAGNTGQNTVNTTGPQTYGGAVTLGNGTTLQGTTVTFNDKVNGSSDGQETLAVTGNAVFGDGVGDFVGDLTRLQSVDVTGTVLLRGGNAGANTIRTAGNQTFGGAVTLANDTTLAGASIQFDGTVEGSMAGVESLAVVGNAVFGNSAADTVGAITSLESLDVTGSSTINGASIRTTRAQNYGGAVTVGTDAILNAGALNFASTVNAAGHHWTAKANSIGIHGTVTGDRITLTSRDAGHDIAINAADTAASVGLSQEELNFITAPILEIGDDQAGDIDIVANTTINSPTVVWNTSGRVTGAAGVGLTAGSLRIDAAGPVAMQGDNRVTTLAGNFAGGLIFRNNTPLTIGAVDGKQGITSGGSVVLITDTLDLAHALDAAGRIVTLQTLTPTRGVVLGAEVGTALSLTDQELDRIRASIIRIGSDDLRAASITVSGDITLGANDTLSLRSAGNVTGASGLQVGNLAIRAGGNQLNLSGQNSVMALAIEAPAALVPIFNNTISANTTKTIDSLAGFSSVASAVFSATAQSQASLSNVEIPLPDRDAVNFVSDGVVTVPTRVTPGSIWTSSLDVPFSKSEKAARTKRVEDSTKFTSGSLSILGSTTGPEAGR